MKIKETEYLQIGYKPELFESVHNEQRIRINKTAVDPKPAITKYWKPKGDLGGQQHHVYVEPFLEFARYIPNKYQLIHFTFQPTEYEIEVAKGLLQDEGRLMFEN